MNTGYRLTLWVGIIVLFALGAWVQANIFLSWDVSYLMQITQKFLNGGHYYTDFMENNPPMILYLYSIPVLAAKALGISWITGVRVFTLLISLLSLGLSAYMIPKIIDKKGQLLKLVVLLSLCFAYWILPTQAFGQREQIMVMLTVPYLLLAVLRCDFQKFNFLFLIVVGVLAGVGFGLKPYFLVPLIFTELYVMYRTRRWFRTESWTIAIILVSYLISIYWLAPNYIHKVLPLVMHFYIVSDLSSLVDLLLSTPVLTWLIAGVFTITLWKNMPYRRFVMVFFIASAGFFIAYLMQYRNWYYHLVPLFSISVLLLFYYAAHCWKMMRSTDTEKPFAYSVSFFIILVAIAWFPFSAIWHLDSMLVRCKHSPQCEFNQLISYVKKHGDGKPIYFFSTTVNPMPVVTAYADVQNASRFPSFWLLPAILKYSSEPVPPARQRAVVNAKQFLLNAVMEDLQRYQPSLVFVDVSKRKAYLGKYKINYLKFMAQNPKFNAFWKNYQYQAQIDKFATYKLADG